MTLFFTIAGAMLLLALSLVLPPLLHRRLPQARDDQGAALNLAVLRDQQLELNAQLDAGLIDDAAFQAARRELHTRVAQDVPAQGQHANSMLARAKPQRQNAAAVGVALSVTLITGFLYAMLGNPAGLHPPAAPPPVAVGPQQIEAMVARLAARLKAEPNDVEGWRRLSRSYETLRRFDLAVDAFRHLLALEPDNADVLVDYAVVLGMTQGGKLTGEPEALLAQVLKRDPHHVQALALAGSAALEHGDHAQALTHWNTLLKLVPPDSPIAQTISESIARATAAAGR
jgi:cytochrome c-type biogenesis protein CcmH